MTPIFSPHVDVLPAAGEMREVGAISLDSNVGLAQSSQFPKIVGRAEQHYQQRGHESLCHPQVAFVIVGSPRVVFLKENCGYFASNNP